ncbi:hypothetical protein [Tetragenococcus koreensis]|uniref:Uncharacterized protein n=1 Tax=Tetragenococcus koreensis TaxID=290335 RepID=A0AAN4UD32_9ENTE|nr:hypothetical protein [Tetragenococcus koreensis]GEQ50242.1 hypothetical protein TK11N_20940 [Tetragenococcus koreensis]GEQ52724.1 hypothetical protein TK12N_20680 [Tetragenococcus koreensis]GEQ55240.1 hypothetical protein TK2N_20840 [Tetragenococcus koreensis]GEQ57725.1 hypothetical protein TK4N_20680 [Tetragenococcus koreensis]GEQ60241.1 hypothetical protein TK6N_20800 [Tetragenococcus koreensis]
MGKTKRHIIWKEKSDLELILLINKFIEKYDIVTTRDYQKALTKHPKEAPSTWFITQKYGSWESLLQALGKVRFNRYRWNQYTDEELKEIVVSYIQKNNIKSQRAYEKKIPGENMPSLSTLKKRFSDMNILFERRKTKQNAIDFMVLYQLKQEIIDLGLEENLSMTEFRKKTKNRALPSVDTILRGTNLSWEALMEKIGYDYRKIKVEKLTKNLK